MSVTSFTYDFAKPGVDCVQTDCVYTFKIYSNAALTTLITPAFLSISSNGTISIAATTAANAGIYYIRLTNTLPSIAVNAASTSFKITLITC
jgi:uncharacterized membrane protein